MTEIQSKIILKPIAYVTNEVKEAKGKIPKDTISEIELIPAISEDSLEGIEAFSHLEIFFFFHKSKKPLVAKSHPRNDKSIQKVGMFSHRSPHRINHIGHTIVKLIKKDGKKLVVLGLDALDGTPILDIKPLVTKFLPKGKIKQPEWINK